MILVLEEGDEPVVNGRILLSKIVISNKFHYLRWLRTNVYGVAVHGYDYFLVESSPLEKKAERTGYMAGIKQPLHHIYFSVDFAMCVCAMVRTKRAIDIRNYLINYKNAAKKG